MNYLSRYLVNECAAEGKDFCMETTEFRLATQLKRKHRKLEESGRCQICRTEDESGHHAVIRCMRATCLRKEMRKIWPRPPEHKFMQNGY
jgi:hypothetical protein